MPTARRSTTRISSAASSATARRRRAARRELALEQVPQRGARRRGAADPASERLQDHEPDRARRIPDHELEALLTGYGHHVHWVSGDEPDEMHRLMAATLDEVVGELRHIQAARNGGAPASTWPMIVLRRRGWTGPKEVDGEPTEGSWRSHQVHPGRGAHQPGAPEGARGLAAQLPRRALRRRRSARSRPRRSSHPAELGA